MATKFLSSAVIGYEREVTVNGSEIIPEKGVTDDSRLTGAPPITHTSAGSPPFCFRLKGPDHLDNGQGQLKKR